MSKKVLTTLLILAAFFVLGFSITANAGKPPPPPSLQVLMSAPLKMDSAACTVLWLVQDYSVAQRDLRVTIHGRYTEVTWDDAQTDAATYNTPVSFSQSGYTSAYCMVTWVGQRGDLTASFCAVAAGTYGSAGCVELK